MKQLALAFFFSFLATFFLTPLTIKFAKKFNLVDNPKVRPHPAHIQKRVIPRAGGIPIFFGVILSILIFVPFDQHVLGIILASMILLMTGLLDDRLKNFSPYPRLILQMTAAFIVVVSGIGIPYISNPFGGVIYFNQFVLSINFFGTRDIILIADILAFLWIVWMMNMINWSKGVDGQMPSIVMIASLTIALLSSSLFLKGDNNQLIIAILATITAGSSLAFLIFNWHPAKILPGQSGSTILGLLIAVLSILSGAKLATALLVLLVPTVDFFYTFFRRILTGQLPFYGDQKHLHHLLLKKGFSHRQISLFYGASCVILGILAINLSSIEKLYAILGLGVLIFGSILWLHFFGQFFAQQDLDSG